jgi:hypothetical protein
MAQMTITRVGVLSVAKIEAAISAVLGLIIGVIYGLVVMVFGAAMMSQSSGAGGSAILLGLLMMIGIPIFYGILGFIVGAIIALVYNVVAGFVGGLEIEVESNDPPAYSAPPPPPQQWGQNQYQSGQGY